MTPAVPAAWRRRASRAVLVGPVSIGGGAPIAVQSMTVADTMDTEACVREVAALVDARCELVRLTVPSRKEAQNLAEIKRRLRERGIAVPLVADVHFTPNAALDAAEVAEKVRINPGNFADRKHFKVREYSDAEYAEELERLERAFLPVLERLRARRVALRIGTNHGSLSDRILNRFGDTPLGMVESALEFVRLCEKHDYRELVLSAKASNVRVMVASYRHLARAMADAGMDYPLHLGVTEAGDGEDGRVKSAVGIGTLLLEGLGDTIRVSLTEDPVREVPVCREILGTIEAIVAESARPELWPRPTEVVGRRAAALAAIGKLSLGAAQPPRVLLDVTAHPGCVDALGHRPSSMAAMPLEGAELLPATLPQARETLALARRLAGRLPIVVRTRDLALARAVRGEGAILALDLSIASLGRDGLSVALGLQPTIITLVGHREMGLAELADLVGRVAARIPSETVVAFEPAAGPVLRTEGYRALAAVLTGGNPLLLRAAGRSAADLVRTSIELGSLLVDGIGDAIVAPVDGAAPLDSLRLLYNILQAAGARVSKTEFISCPSCGRTVFDLEETTARIKEKTAHLTGVKIAIMGCIVNGPGEMADADFGYVGASPGTVHLFVGKELVGRGIPAAEADLRLIELIKAHGRWVEPPVLETV